MLLAFLRKNWKSCFSTYFRCAAFEKNHFQAELWDSGRKKSKSKWPPFRYILLYLIMQSHNILDGKKLWYLCKQKSSYKRRLICINTVWPPFRSPIIILCLKTLEKNKDRKINKLSKWSKLHSQHYAITFILMTKASFAYIQNDRQVIWRLSHYPS